MSQNENGRIVDEIKAGIGGNGEEVIVGNEQYAGEPGPTGEPNGGPDPDQWPVENRDMRLKVNRDDYDPAAAGTPDPAQWPQGD